jgi:uncharacterized protein YdeI (YjbR/CyaY-like superfamily)
MSVDFSRLQRPRQLMPADVRETLESRGLMDKFRLRPAYQQNDYLGWLRRARHAETRQKRLEQMLDELERGNVYMNMKWNPR